MSNSNDNGDSTGEGNVSFIATTETMDRKPTPPTTIPAHEFSEPPCVLGLFSRLTMELRWLIYELAFDTVYWVRGDRPKSFYEHWGQLPSIWHREPSCSMFGLGVSRAFDADVELSINPNAPWPAGTHRPTLGVKINAHCWMATHDPLLLCRNDVTAIDITVFPPTVGDPGQLIWIRRNAQEFMRHWDASGVRVKQWSVTFAENGKNSAWDFSRVVQIRPPYFFAHLGYASGGIDRVLSILRPAAEALGTNRTVKVPESFKDEHKMCETLAMFRADIPYAKWLLFYRDQEQDIEIRACGCRGPTGMALLKERFEHARVYEERGYDLTFEWERHVDNQYSLEGAITIYPREVMWEERHDILDRVGWDKTRLLELEKDLSANRRRYGFSGNYTTVYGVATSPKSQDDDTRMRYTAMRRLYLIDGMTPEELEVVKKQYSNGAMKGLA
jgi:hypothetical protein